MAIMTLTYDERKERALDLIAFLSAFGVPRVDAVEIFFTARVELLNMNVEKYANCGNEMTSFVQSFSRDN